LIRNFAVEDYARLLNGAACIVGNSSSGLREGAFLGTPCVNIGSRQRNRERAQNVIDVPHQADAIYSAVEGQISRGRYPRSFLFGDGHAGVRIADILADATLKLDKSLNYLNSQETNSVLPQLALVAGE
jgi:UDP-N-acetylglucosamine 2-epimerase